MDDRPLEPLRHGNPSSITTLPRVDCRENIKIGGNFTAYMNLADERLVGKYDGYRVVEGRMDIDGDKFGLRLGTREEPGNVFLDVSPVGGIDGTFYLQASAGVPNAFTYPERPQFITDLLSEISGGDFSYDKNATHRGFEASQSNAFAMIAGAKITATAAVDFSIIYARFDAMLGFDASLLPNEGIACVGGGSLGFGDYQHYGLGQAYAGLDGEIGLDIDVFGYKGKFLLAKIKAAMLLEAGFPNPVFAKGQAAMSYSVLGGIVSGKTHFELQVGEQCETYVADPLVGIKFIEGIVPNSKEGVSVFVKPILSLQNEIGEFQFQNEHEEWVSMDVRLEEFKIMNSNFVDLNIPYKIGPDGLSYDLNVSALEPYKTYHVTAMIKAYRLENGTWVQAISGGQPFKEDFTVSFTTGPRPKTVVFENVEDCYPFLNEDYYMIENNLNNKGIIKLKSTQQELFEPFTPSNQQWHSKAQARIAYNYYGNLGATEWKDVTYVPGLNVITYDFPSNQLATNRQYKVQIKRVWYENTSYDKSIQDLSAENISTSTNNLSSSYTINKEGKSYANVIEKKPADDLICSYTFRTSRYRKFDQKVRGFSTGAWPNDSYTYFQISNNEPFSQQEMGSKYIHASRTVSKNYVTIEEDYARLRGYWHLWQVYHFQNKMNKVGVPWVGQGNESDFVKNYARDGEILFDNIRHLYVNEGQTIINFRSNINGIFPTQENIRNFDFWIAYAVGWEDTHIKQHIYHNHNPEYWRILNWWRNNGAHNNESRVKSWEIDHRLRVYRGKIRTNAAISHLTDFRYRIPMVQGQNINYQEVQDGMGIWFTNY